MQNEDNEYQKATKTVVNDAMRIDVLGPNVCKVLREHTPTGDQLRLVIVSAIAGDVKVREALGKFNEDQAITRKGKGVTHLQTAIVSIVGTLILTLLGTTIYNHYIH